MQTGFNAFAAWPGHVLLPCQMYEKPGIKQMLFRAELEKSGLKIKFMLKNIKADSEFLVSLQDMFRAGDSC